MKIIKNISLIFFLVLFPIIVKSQCKNFATEQALPLLKDFILSGRMSTHTLKEGEKILIFKTLNKNLVYRFVVISDENLPQPHFILSDWENNIIYDNANNNYNPIFDYVSTKAQRVKILIEIPKHSKNKDELKEGCVSLVLGAKANK